MRFRIDYIVAGALAASAALTVLAQGSAQAPATAPKQMTQEEKKAADEKKAAAKKAADEKKAAAKKAADEKKAAAKKAADDKKAAAKKAADEKKAAAKKAADAKKAQATPLKKNLERAATTPVHSSVKQPGAGPIIEKRTVTDKGRSPFSLTDKDGKPVATSPDAYDVGSATTPPKKR